MDSFSSPDETETRITTPVSNPESTIAIGPAWTGRRVGRYLVLEQLGSGGMGEVYLAYDPELDRRVALKVLRRDRNAGREAQDRLLREAQALAKLAHPNVVAVHDVGTVKLGELSEPAIYVAMEFVAGQTLRKWALGTDDWRAIARTYRAAALGLAAAHAQGIVHRDFKPTNVLVGEDGRVRVLDFGLARRVDEAHLLSPEDLEDSLDRSSHDSETSAALSRSSIDLALTQTGVVLGTPAYMSPEQFVGTDVDARSDQFSFCVALYEALFQVRPFSGRDATKIARRIRRQQFADPKRPVAIPKRLRTAIRRGLAYRAEDRHPDMPTLIAELDRVLRPLPRGVIAVGAIGVVTAGGVWLAGGTTVPAADPCTGAEAKLESVWNPPRYAEIKTAFAATELSYALDAGERIGPAVDGWSQTWVEARREACVATRVRGDQSEEMMDLRIACLDDRLRNLDALLGAFETADGDVVENAVQSAWGLDAVDLCADPKYLRAAVRPPEDPKIAGSVDEIRADAAGVWAMVSTGKYADGAKAGKLLLEAARPLDYDPLRAEVALLTGQAMERAGQLDDVRALLEESLYAAERCGHSAVAAEALVGLAGFVGYQEAEMDAGLRYSDHAQAVLTRIDDPSGLLPGLDVARGNTLLRGGKLAEAVARYQAAIEATTGDPTAQRHNLAASVNIGTAYGMLGDDKAALAALEIAAQRTREALGAGHPTYGTAVMNIGATQWRMGEYEAAWETLAEAQTVLEAALGPEHPHVARLLHNQGAVLRDQQKLDDALAKYEQAVTIKRKLFGQAHPTVALTYSNMGDIYYAQGRYDLADEALQDAIAAWETAVGPDHPDLAIGLSTLGRVRVAQHRPLEAIELLERASKLRGEHAPHREQWEQKLGLAQALHEAGRERERALRLAREASSHLAQSPGSTEADHAKVRAVLLELRAEVDEGTATPEDSPPETSPAP